VRGARSGLPVLAVLLALAAPCGRVAAHQVELSSARLELSADRAVRLELAMKGSDVDRVAGTKIVDMQTGLVDAGRLAASTAPIVTYVTAHIGVVSADGAPCRLAPVTVAPDEDGIVARLAWSCDAAGGDLVYRSTLLVDAEPAARQVVLIGGGKEPAQALLDATRTELRLTAPPPTLLEVIGRYSEAGIEHIFLGYDHIAFLIAIVLWARRLWPVVKIVTAFTIAHSITLSLAALGIIVVPSVIVEPAIAASIVFVAVENFFSRDIDRRWRDTFGFGLIHGFGFAAALQEFGLPRGNIAAALGAFNLGVEIGQVAIVSLVIPALILLDRAFASPSVTSHAPALRPAPLVYLLSGGIAVLGCYWVLERTVLA
jgi:hydrogenase/urease accessory protein HupE